MRRLSLPERLVLWFGFLGGPAAWALHLVVGYAWEEWACARGQAVDLTEPLLAGVTVALGVVCLLAGAGSLVLWRRAVGGRVADPRGRVAFMGLAGLVASGISLVIVVLGGVQLAALDACVR